MTYYKTSYYYQILDQHDIKATAIRISLLRIIYTTTRQYLPLIKWLMD